MRESEEKGRIGREEGKMGRKEGKDGKKGRVRETRGSGKKEKDGLVEARQGRDGWKKFKMKKCTKVASTNSHGEKRNISARLKILHGHIHLRIHTCTHKSTYTKAREPQNTHTPVQSWLKMAVADIIFSFLIANLMHRSEARYSIPFSISR